MANKTKATLKTFFQTGDIPSEQNYVDFIDSKYNLEETGVQTSKGTFSGSVITETITNKGLFTHLGSSVIGNEESDIHTITGSILAIVI